MGFYSPFTVLIFDNPHNARTESGIAHLMYNPHMYPLQQSYGRRTYRVWNEEKRDDLSGTQTNTSEAREDWEVHSFSELLGCVAFLTSMNKRLTLFFRGQTSDEWEPLPMLFRSEWRCFESKRTFAIGENRQRYWEELPRIGERVFRICEDKALGLPRRLGLRDIREVQWAVIQHYEIWPTPLIDITSSLRMAASFAMDHCSSEGRERRVGFVYVVGMPESTGSITFDIDQHVCLARLQSCCPPVALRPHFQEGFLVGRFPINSMNDLHLVEKSSLLRRLVAKFKLIDMGNFWDENFPIIGHEAVCPKDDPLESRLREEFGETGKYPVGARAESFVSK